MPMKPSKAGKAARKTAPRRPKAESIGYLARYAHRAFVKALAHELETHAILSAQWSVLRVLWETEGLTQVELADRMRVEKASLTAVLGGMARAGLIRRARNAKDRRKINITLTARGRALKDEILPYAGRINRRATRGMSRREVERLRELLGRLIRNLER
ncbi:MAG: MarR family winged helix-turn-helix transcriptional regulator [Pseudolabrys sp.]